MDTCSLYLCKNTNLVNSLIHSVFIDKLLKDYLQKNIQAVDALL